MPGHTVVSAVLTGVTVMVAVTGAVPVLIATKDGINGEATGADPLAANPIDELLFTQLYAVAFVPVKFTCAVLVP
jgi:formate hydrogenlyase subunit 3/multisubunit Na+/H+ antiporter MnhD subunit